ncbi:nucleoprotein TPR-like isoform X5 [Tripterygium wilfordii]|uniref:Nucleoprotein TPR-like isoform X5 n=1 Tax=Tripterygium wilfordii TaxID=458696 RepID=A0A7J7CGN8_TRIWF|nr:myosin-10 isoform X2 [Tripterygium wilfordii]KAF5733212.1 nucleoprotein TPR-like isoform X5 [Tripterygium wilfordii]
MSVENYTKILSNYVCSKLDLATLLWLLECIFKAGLEQEIEDLKKKLATCTRENLNLQEELSEAYRIKGQLADLHSAEVAKNMESEKQVKFFQGCVATAFAERDHSIMEAEKAKEKEEFMSQRHNEIQKRLEDLTSDCFQQKRINDTLSSDLAKLEEQNEAFKKVIDNFFNIRHHSVEGLEDIGWDDKCARLLSDPVDMWSFNDSSSSMYISSLEEELERLRNSVDNLQNKLRVGLEIENHLKKTVRDMKKKKMLSYELIINGIAGLRLFHSQHRAHVMNLLSEGKSHIESIICLMEEKIQQLDVRGGQSLEPQRVREPDEYDCRDIHTSTNIDCDLVPEINDPGLSDTVSDKKGIAADVLTQALQEKVAALLLLSQQEERHLLERNVYTALQEKVDELQRNLLQVTNEKVKALMELAWLKQEYQRLHESNNSQMQGKLINIVEKRPVNNESDGRLRNLFKKTYLRRWVGTQDFSGSEAEQQLNNDGNFSSRRSNSMDYARMKIENATLKESMESMEHLTNSIHRLRLSILKVKESVTSEGTFTNVPEVIDDIITEAKLLKTALGSSLPISWSAEVGISTSESKSNELGDDCENPSREKIDFVSAAGFEMVELVVLAAQILRDKTTSKGS